LAIGYPSLLQFEDHISGGLADQQPDKYPHSRAHSAGATRQQLFDCAMRVSKNVGEFPKMLAVDSAALCLKPRCRAIELSWAHVRVK
jgi:hypothetical protein